MILQWLYRGAGRQHPDVSTRAGGFYLYEHELAETGLTDGLRNRIRDLRAQIGVAPHLVRSRDDEGDWIARDESLGILTFLLRNEYEIFGGMDTTFVEDEEGVDLTEYAMVPHEDGVQPETISSCAWASHPKAREVMWSIVLPGGWNSHPDGIGGVGQPPNDPRLGRWSRDLIRQRFVSGVTAGNFFNPHGSTTTKVVAPAPAR